MVGPVDPLQRNNVARQGNPSHPLMVFAHGFGCDQGMWRLVAPSFAETHHLVLFDHVGAGGADPSAYDVVRHSALDGYADDVIELLEALEAGPAIFVGHSVSAMIAVLAARRRPELFARLVMVGPSARYLDDEGYVGGFSAEAIEELLATMGDNYLGWAAHLAPIIMGAPERPELAAELERSFCQTDPELAKRFARTTFLSDNRADLPHVPTPSLVLQAREDVIASMQVGRYVHDHLPVSEFAVLETTGHCPHLSAPSELIGAMRRYLLSA